MLSPIKTIAMQAEPEATTFTRRTWKDRTLVKTHVAAFALGIAAVAYVQHYAPAEAKANASTPPTSVLTGGEATTTTAAPVPK
jgi:hypothetical protein